jgi:hypothetical protein
MLALDLAILNDGATKIGYLKSDYLAPLVINDVLTTAGSQNGQISMPVEFWISKDGKKTFMVCRSDATNSRSFSAELVEFVKSHGFSSVALLTSAFSPIKRERDSNREIPEVFAFCNEFLEKNDFYAKTGLRKYGWWIDKKKPYQELKELGQGGWSARLFRAFNKVEMPCSMFLVFCQGGVDFVGGFVMY